MKAYKSNNQKRRAALAEYSKNIMTALTSDDPLVDMSKYTKKTPKINMPDGYEEQACLIIN